MKKLVGLTALVAMLAFAGAALAEGRTVRVSGIQAPPDATAGTPGDPCAAVDPETGQPAQANVMAGRLIGCWYTDTYSVISTTVTGVIHAIGSEHFVGCLNIGRHGDCTEPDPTGTLALTYTFEFKPDPVTGNELWGHCEHQIVSGTGGFAGAAGRIDFTDNVSNGTSAYRGHITLADRDRTAHATAAEAAAVSQPRPSSMC
jgi:hypothetical protein